MTDFVTLDPLVTKFQPKHPHLFVGQAQYSAARLKKRSQPGALPPERNVPWDLNKKGFICQVKTFGLNALRTW